jgi:hypothetical protein
VFAGHYTSLVFASLLTNNILDQADVCMIRHLPGRIHNEERRDQRDHTKWNRAVERHPERTYLTGIERDLWTCTRFPDLVCLRSHTYEDFLSTRISNNVVKNFHIYIGQHFRVCPLPEISHT